VPNRPLGACLFQRSLALSVKSHGCLSNKEHNRILLRKQKWTKTPDTTKQKTGHKLDQIKIICNNQQKGIVGKWSKKNYQTDNKHQFTPAKSKALLSSSTKQQVHWHQYHASVEHPIQSNIAT
jgi:hypothetical protein